MPTAEAMPLHDLVEERRLRIMTKRVQRGGADGIQFRLVADQQFGLDRFFGFEVVVQAARQDAARVGDVLERRAGKSGRREERGRGLQDFEAARTLGGGPCAHRFTLARAGPQA
jgi:hypothetical protein